MATEVFEVGSAATPFTVDSDGNAVVSGALAVTGPITAPMAPTTLAPTGAVTLIDANTSIVDDAAPTKILKFQVSGITAGQTRTITVPDASFTLPSDPASSATLALTTAGNGAALVGIQDAGGLITATQAEAAFAELAALRNDATIADPGNAGAISVAKGGACAIVTAGAETRTMAAPTKIGQMITLLAQTLAGDCVVTVASAINAAGNTVITLNGVGDNITLFGAWNGVALQWRARNDGCVLT